MSGRPDQAELALYEAMEREFTGAARPQARGRGEIAPAADLEPEVDEWMSLNQPADAPKGSLWEMVDDRLRGRWRIMILLGLVMAVLLAIIGFRSAEPMYRGEGLVRINDAVNILVPGADASPLGRNAESFIAMQADNIRGAEVIDAALHDDQMNQFPWVSKVGAKGRLRDYLVVEPHWQSHQIGVAYDSEDAHEAFVAISVVLKAYETFFGDTRQRASETRKQQLQTEIDSLTKANDSALAEIGERRKNHNASDLDAVLKSNLAKIQDAESYIVECKHFIARAETAQDPNSPESQELQNPSDRNLEAFDKQLAQYRDLLNAAETSFDLVKGQYQPASPMYRNAENKLSQYKDLYEAKRKKVLQDWRESVQAGGPQVLPDSPFYRLTEDEVRQRLAEKTKTLKDLTTENAQLLEDSQKITRLQHDIDINQKDIDARNTDLQLIIRGETSLANLIEVDVPTVPPREAFKDQRLARLGMGAVAGFGFSFGIFFLWGTIDRRAFGAAQLGAGARMPACLGVLPDLGRSMKDPESSDVASHCVHQIRNQIEAVRGAAKSCVIAFTSPFQGDGKTSIVMALSWSYAAAGYKTIVVDCDMVGRSLTRQLGLIGREGLKEVLKSDHINGEITPLAVPNLSALPVGATTHVGPESVRRVDMQRLFEQLKKSYEVILVDTGPLLGALETTPVAATADGVVLAVRRGRSKVRLQECVKKLEQVGARCFGVILNCAIRSECHRYVSEASLAAAEDNRASRSGSAQTIVRRPTAGERNALVRAMEENIRAREES